MLVSVGPTAAAHSDTQFRRFRSLVAVGLAMIAGGIALGIATAISGAAIAFVILIGVFFIMLGSGGMRAARKRVEARRANHP
jgi:dipeptide/tripeptide permease